MISTPRVVPVDTIKMSKKKGGAKAVDDSTTSPADRWRSGVDAVVRSRSTEAEADSVMDIAKITSQLRRSTIHDQRNDAAHRLRDRLLERRGLLSAQGRQHNKQESRLNRPKIAPSSRTQIEAEVESRRVEVEARRASKLHAEKTLRRQSTSAARVHDRLAARNKVKSSRCLHMCSCFASLEDASVSQIVDVMQYSVKNKGEVLCRQG